MSHKEELKKLKASIVGKTIVDVEFLDDESMHATGWYERPVMLVLDDGGILVPQRDEEGNGGGVLTHHQATEPTYTCFYTIPHWPSQHEPSP